jgi:hypothetical protein
MRVLKETILAVHAATLALALAHKASTGEVIAALAKPGVDVTAIPHPNGNTTVSSRENAVSLLISPILQCWPSSVMH